MSEEEKDPAEEQEETEVVPEVDPTSQMSAREYFEHRLNELFKLAEDEKQKRLKELMMWQHQAKKGLSAKTEEMKDALTAPGVKIKKDCTAMAKEVEKDDNSETRGQKILENALTEGYKGYVDSKISLNANFSSLGGVTNWIKNFQFDKANMIVGCDTCKNVNHIASFHENTNKVVIHDLKSQKSSSLQIEGVGNFEKPGWTWIMEGSIFACGFNKTSTAAGILNLSGNYDAVASMNKARSTHAVIAFNSKVYAFGGYNGTRMRAAEVYDIEEDAWTELQDMPRECAFVNCVLNGCRIFITGFTMGTIVEFNPMNNTYYELSAEIPRDINKGLIATPSCLLVITANDVCYEVDYIGQEKGQSPCTYNGTNIQGEPILYEGVYYFVTYSKGKCDVQSFNPDTKESSLSANSLQA